MVIVTKIWARSQINIWQEPLAPCWLLGNRLPPKANKSAFRQLQGSVWMPCVETGCGMKKGLTSLAIVLFRMRSSVKPSLMQPWLPLRTTFSLRHVSQSLKRVAARKVKRSSHYMWKKSPGTLLLEPDLPTVVSLEFPCSALNEHPDAEEIYIQAHQRVPH